MRISIADWPIARKILALVGLLGTVSAVIATTGVVSVDSLGRSTDRLDIAATEIKLGGQLNTRIVALSRAEYNLATDPSQLAELKPEIDRMREEARALLAEALETAGEERRQMLMEVEAALETYVAELDQTVAIAERVGAIEIGADQRQLIAAVEASREESSVLREKAGAYVAYVEDRAATISSEASSTASATMIIIVAVGVIGVAGGIGIGFFESRQTIVRPLGTAIKTLRQLADGNLEVEITGNDRKDEIGDIARALVVFKDGAMEQRRMVAEQEEEAKRKAAMAEQIRGSYE